MVSLRMSVLLVLAMCTTGVSWMQRRGNIASMRRHFSQLHDSIKFSIADQKQRHAKAVTDKNDRVLNLESIYKPGFLKGKTALVTGGNRGIGRALVNELVAQGCRKVIATTQRPADIPGVHVVSGIDVTDDSCGSKLAESLKGEEIDFVINNAGYFYEPLETLSSLIFHEEKKMIDICALGPLRVTSGLVNGGLLAAGAKVAIISSQGGSVSWRFVQNPQGHDYGHHMSKAAANMAGVLLAQELRSKGIAVVLLHPGFNKTDMTKKYEAIWDEEGAVDTSLGAKRILHEMGQLTMETTGSFINCEDGLHIPF